MPYIKSYRRERFRTIVSDSLRSPPLDKCSNYHLSWCLSNCKQENKRNLRNCMQNKTATPLASYVERARKVLQHEQRTHHQDRAITSGGLAAFTARWYDETCAICKQTGLDAGAIHRFVEHLEGYRQQDPMQR